MDIPALRDELITDPLSRGYAAMTDAQVAASLKVKNRTKHRRVPSSEVLKWSGANGRASRIRKAANGVSPFDSLPDEIRSVAIVADVLVNRGDISFDSQDLGHVAMSQALILGSVLSQEDVNALLSLSTEPCSREDELGLGSVGDGHVKSAREI